MDLDIMSKIMAALPGDELARSVIEKLRQVSTEDANADNNTWSITSAEAPLDEGRIYAPEATRTDVIPLHHDAPESGHFGIARTV